MDRKRSAQSGPEGRVIKYFETLDSTNITAKEFAEKGAPEGTVIQAGQQLAGRGRLGRVWKSQAGKGLWFSLILYPKTAAEFCPQVTLLTAVAVAEALQKAAGVQGRIKWPNDILLDDRKICGILSEMALTTEGAIEYAIVGIGININMSSEDFGAVLADTAASLYLATGMEYECKQVLKAVLEEFDQLYGQWHREGFAPIRKKWREYNCTLGRMVTVKDNDEEIYSGTAEDVDDYGSLLVRNAAGKIESFDFGEVSIRSC
ncbi:biotin--[acetyl-CoA-carboxylase] ligase [Phascolarctobacterium sp.]